MRLEDARAITPVTSVTAEDKIPFLPLDSRTTKTVETGEWLKDAVGGLPTEADLKTARIVINSTDARIQLTVADVSGQVTVTSGDKHMMSASGTTPVLEKSWWPGEYIDPTIIVFNSYGTPDYGGVPNSTAYYFDSVDQWYIFHFDGDGEIDYQAQITSTAATPDLIVGTWTVTIGSGQPSIVASAATGASVVAAINTAALGFTAANASGNDGTGTVAAVTAQTMVPQGDGTEGVTLSPTGDNNNITITAASAVPANGLWVDNGIVKINS